MRRKVLVMFGLVALLASLFAGRRDGRRPEA